MSTWATGIEVVPEPPQIEGATYLGCFQDMRYERTLEVGYIDNDDMTNQVRTTYRPIGKTHLLLYMRSTPAHLVSQAHRRISVLLSGFPLRGIISF